MSRGLGDVYKRQVITPLQNKVKGILNKVDQSWKDDAIIEKELNEFLDELNEGLGVEEDTIIYQCQQEVINEVRAKVSTISGDIYNNTIGSVNKSVDNALKAVNKSIEDINKKITSIVNKKIGAANKKLKEEVEKLKNSGEEKVKEKINSALTDYSTKIAGSFPENKDGTKGSNSSVVQYDINVRMCRSRSNVYGNVQAEYIGKRRNGV